MMMPHRLDHYSLLYTKDNGARVRTPYLQDANVPCFYQPAGETTQRPTVRADVPRETAAVYMVDGAIWEDIQVGHVVKVDGLWLEVKGKKNLCNLSRYFRLDVQEDISGELDV